MRAAFVTVPLGFVLGAAGVGFWMAARPPAVSGSAILSQPRHPVTPEMWRSAKARQSRPAPDFEVEDARGARHSLASLTRGKPLFVYFILDGCPCSIDAEPLLQRLYEHHGGRVSFLGISSGAPNVAEKWVADWTPRYPVAAAPPEQLRRLFGVDRSVYSLLIDQRGTIVRMWPGYSAAMLQEASDLMSRLTGKPAGAFDPLYAPKEMTSGCSLAEGAGT